MLDLVVRDGLVVDGTGADGIHADVAVADGRIVAVGTDVGRGRREIDADGRLVTPGFVDVHTHYDGQVTWDDRLEPSSPHGVTTAVMGNCGVGFAPAAPDRHGWLIELMEGVEDIPGAALSEGLDWAWESFPEYLDALSRRRLAVDVGALVAHGPVRAYVMGERGAANEPATADDTAAMATIVEAAVRAGAMGFSTSRTITHRAMDGEPVPGTFAAADELWALAAAVARAGHGLVEVAPAGVSGEDLVAPRREVDWMCRLSDELGVTVTWLMLQNDFAPDDWRELLDRSAAAQARGHRVVPQVAGRPFGILLGLAARHRFLDCPSYLPLAELPLPERVAVMGRPEVRDRIVAESRQQMELLRAENPVSANAVDALDRTYLLGEPADYEPGPERSIAGIARRLGQDPVEVLYDAHLERGGNALLMRPFLGYAHGNGDALREMLGHPAAVLGLADGGAHCNLICDASTPTWMLTHWARDRSRGPGLALPEVVRKMTSETARLFGMTDRGVIAPGLRADLNVIDHDGLTLHEPELVHDLPAGGSRFLQRATGYDATVVAGEVTREHDAFTDARPGRLVRGGR